MRWLVIAAVLLAACRRERRHAASQSPTPNPTREPKVTTPPLPDSGACAYASVLLTPEGISLGTSADHHRFVASCAGAIDRVALDEAACELAQRPELACTESVELAARGGVPYADLVTVMDRLVSVGLPDVGLADEGSLSVAAASKDQRVPARCDQATAAPCPVRKLKLPNRVTLPAPQIDPASIPILTVDRDRIVLDRQLVMQTRDLGTSAALEQALLAHPMAAQGSVILQVDRSVDAQSVNAITKILYLARYHSIQFAVQRAP